MLDRWALRQEAKFAFGLVICITGQMEGVDDVRSALSLSSLMGGLQNGNKSPDEIEPNNRQMCSDFDSKLP